MIVCTLGNFATGSVDAVGDIAGCGKQQGIWVHVDAAIGGFHMLLDDFRTKYQGAWWYMHESINQFSSDLI